MGRVTQERARPRTLPIPLPAEVDAILVNEAHIEITKLARLGYSRDEVERAVNLALRFGSAQFAASYTNKDADQ
jgi:hypothetical protein